MAAQRKHPYSNLPERNLWPKAVRDRHFADLEDLWEPFELSRSEKVATAGSCFAQHLGRNLKERGANYLDMEPAPDFLGDEDEARKWGFGVFSCRYGNIYTVRQLCQLFEEAFHDRKPADPVWEKNGRYFDALRANVDPLGWPNAETVMALRERHISKVREMFSSLDLFVFTLGLTEGWEDTVDGTIYPTAPGVVAGEYDAERYRFRNFKYPDILDDLQKFWEMLRGVNSGARMLLTVSPVPLMATASAEHVLVATSYSKSTLRAAAGDFCERTEGVYYFPSYEIIVSPQARGMAFDPDQRSVNQFGVNMVMKHFFSGRIGAEFSSDPTPVGDFNLICDEDLLSGTC